MKNSLKFNDSCKYYARYRDTKYNLQRFVNEVFEEYIDKLNEYEVILISYYDKDDESLRVRFKHNLSSNVYEYYHNIVYDEDYCSSSFEEYLEFSFDIIFNNDNIIETDFNPSLTMLEIN